MRASPFWGLLLCCWLGQAALAKPKAPPPPPPPPKLTQQQIKQAAAKVDQADKLFKKGLYEKAMAIYQEVYTLTLEPLMLFNIAQCQRKLGQYEAARDNYKTFLQRAPDYEQRSLAQELLAECEAEISKTMPPKEGPPWPLVLYANAGLVASLSVTFGAIALSSANQASEIQEAGDASQFSEIDPLFLRARRLSVASDILLASSVALAGTGLFLAHQQKQASAQLSVGPNALSLTVRF